MELGKKNYFNNNTQLRAEFMYNLMKGEELKVHKSKEKNERK